MADRSVVIRIGADISSYESGLKRAASETQSAAGEIEGAANSVTTGWNDAGDAVTKFGGSTAGAVSPLKDLDMWVGKVMDSIGGLDRTSDTFWQDFSAAIEDLRNQGAPDDLLKGLVDEVGRGQAAMDRMSGSTGVFDQVARTARGTVQSLVVSIRGLLITSVVGTAIAGLTWAVNQLVSANQQAAYSNLDLVDTLDAVSGKATELTEKMIFLELYSKGYFDLVAQAGYTALEGFTAAIDKNSVAARNIQRDFDKAALAVEALVDGQIEGTAAADEAADTYATLKSLVDLLSGANGNLTSEMDKWNTAQEAGISLGRESKEGLRALGETASWTRAQLDDLGATGWFVNGTMDDLAQAARGTADAFIGTWAAAAKQAGFSASKIAEAYSLAALAARLAAQIADPNMSSMIPSLEAQLNRVKGQLANIAGQAKIVIASGGGGGGGGGRSGGGGGGGGGAPKGETAKERERREKREAKERDARIKAARRELRMDLRRGGFVDDATSGIGGAYGLVDRLLADSQNADLSKKKRTRLADMAKDAEKEFRKLYKQADSLAAKLEVARDRVAELSQIKAGVQSVLQGEFRLADALGRKNAFGYDVPVTSKSLVADARARAAKIKAFAGKLSQLQKMGLSGIALQEVAMLGSDQGTLVADALIKGGKTDINALNAAYKDIEHWAGQAGQYVTEGFYKGGLAAAEGIVKGLEDKESEVLDAIRALAQKMQDELKKAWGIKSPSTVARGMAHRVMEGWNLGLGDVQSAPLAHPTSVGVSRGSGSGSGSGSNVVELNPRDRALLIEVANRPVDVRWNLGNREVARVWQEGEKQARRLA